MAGFVYLQNDFQYEKKIIIRLKTDAIMYGNVFLSTKSDCVLYQQFSSSSMRVRIYYAEEKKWHKSKILCKECCGEENFQDSTSRYFLRSSLIIGILMLCAAITVYAFHMGIPVEADH